MSLLTRKSFLAALFAPLLARFAPKAKALPMSGVAIARANYLPPVQLTQFVELPSRITGLHTYGDRLFAFTESGLFEVFGDGSYRMCFTEGTIPAEIQMPPRFRYGGGAGCGGHVSKDEPAVAI